LPKFTVGDVTVRQGEIGFGGLGEISLPDTTSIKIPLIVVNGSHNGPTLMLSSTIHGTELAGAEVIRRITREIVKPQDLRGKIIALPIGNPLAFSAHTANTPQDCFNLNRVFPGSPTGSTTDRLADAITANAVSKSDLIIDFHANPDPAMCFTITERYRPDVDRKVIAMAEAFGITNIMTTPELEPHVVGTLDEVAANFGLPALVVELLYWRRQNPIAVNVGVRGALNVMKKFKMLDGPVEKQTDTPVVNGTLSRVEVTADRGGIVHPTREIAQWVKKGEAVAKILNPYGDVVSKVLSPVNGFMLAYPLLGNQAVTSGDHVAFIGFRRR